MADISSDLEQLRRRIDEIDDQLLDLLIKRLGVIADLSNIRDKTPYQPAREAEILRRLTERCGNQFPAATLIRMWRELLGATTSFQGAGAFAVAVYVPADMEGIWDLARDHFGSHTAMRAYHSANAVIGEVRRNRETVGVLPLPSRVDGEPWWQLLVSTASDAPRVIARLPFGSRGNARPNPEGALAIGHGAQQRTDRDRSLFASENATGTSLDLINNMLSSVGLRCTFIAGCEQAESATTLIELDGFIELDNSRLDAFKKRFGADLQRIVTLGGYAVPLTVADLSPAGGATRG